MRTRDEMTERIADDVIVNICGFPISLYDAYFRVSSSIEYGPFRRLSSPFSIISLRVRIMVLVKDSTMISSTESNSLLPFLLDIEEIMFLIRNFYKALYGTFFL